MFICACLFIRFIFDIIRITFREEFSSWRCTEANGADWGYPIFLACLIFVIEYLPILMFSVNIKYVFNHQASLKPRERDPKYRSSNSG